MKPVTTVLLCRGCCCGTDKHPHTDHDAQRASLEQAAHTAGLALRVVDCLDECGRSNVLVVRRPGRRPAERDTWLGGLTTDKATTALTDWVAQGAPEPLPTPLTGYRFRHLPPRRR